MKLEVKPPNTMPECHAIIPARFASTRFPGKPLAEILGKPMFFHVYQRARQCPYLASVTLATDDARIIDAANELNVPVVLTSSEHQSGTDRVYEAACILKCPKDSVIVNIQGDEPALEPEILSCLVSPFTDPNVQVSTLARPLLAHEALTPDRVKLVMANNGDALYFSRASIPYIRNNEDAASFPENLFWMHLGLYAFRFNTLKKFTSLPVSALEQLEQLEQLRLLENKIPIRVVKVNCLSFGVDSPEDLEKVSKVMNA